MVTIRNELTNDLQKLFTNGRRLVAPPRHDSLQQGMWWAQRRVGDARLLVARFDDARALWYSVFCLPLRIDVPVRVVVGGEWTPHVSCLRPYSPISPLNSLTSTHASSTRPLTRR